VSYGQAAAVTVSRAAVDAITSDPYPESAKAFRAGFPFP
jgi:hypothetical protein